MKIVSIHEPLRADIDVRLSRNALNVHRLFLRTALSGGLIFSWIFVFQYYYVVSPDIAHAFARTALLYALSQVVICLATPLSARLLRYGARRELMEAALFLAAAFVVLGATFEGFWGGGAYAAWGIVAFAVLLGFYRAFYWIPYEVEAEEAGRSGGEMWREVAVALMPAFVGFIILGSGTMPWWLLFGAAALATVAIIPLHSLRDVHELFPWGYRETFAECMASENRDVIRQAIFDGAYGAALLFIWPIAVFLIVGWSYGMLGIILSLTFLVGILGRGTMRRIIRKLKLHESPLVNVLLVVSPWILRLGVATPLGVVLVDSYFYTTTPRRGGMDPVVFEQASDAGYFLDRYTAIKEVGLGIGRLCMCVFAATLALYISLPAAFIGAFLAAAFVSIWSAR